MSLTKPSSDSGAKKVIWWPATIQEPQDGGVAVMHKVNVQFEIISESEKDAIIAEGGDEAFLDRVIRGWKGFLEADGSEIPYNEETRKPFFEVTWIKNGLVHAYFKAATGGKRKNS
ncbi:MAG: hypothetical protein EPO20_05535 [Betaproteobacteria bacterium]|nr:MAG: hypothetical protein EPO20_05535 [Betaproteobacteria bacterium]